MAVGGLQSYRPRLLDPKLFGALIVPGRRREIRACLSTGSARGLAPPPAAPGSGASLAGLDDLVDAPEPAEQRGARHEDVGAVERVDPPRPHRADLLPARARRALRPVHG